MKRVNIISITAVLLAVSLASAGCNQSVVLGSKPTEEQLQEKTISNLHDAKLYCLGILLYAQKHQNVCPANLSQTLPYLRTAERLPSGTNHFEIFYRGSFDKLPNTMTNGIIVIRSDSWQTTDGKRMRIYGFADGHCEAHSEPDDDFAAWEKQHSLSP